VITLVVKSHSRSFTKSKGAISLIKGTISQIKGALNKATGALRQAVTLLRSRFLFKSGATSWSRLDRETSTQLRLKDRGSAESALVLLPTLILFLSVVQLSGYFLSQIGFSNSVQGQVARAALVQSQVVAELPGIENISLPGGGSILLGTSRQSLPLISSLFPDQPVQTFSGIAIREN